MAKNNRQPSGSARRDAFLRKVRDIKRKQRGGQQKKGK
jgi:hypothetical protein